MERKIILTDGKEWKNILIKSSKTKKRLIFNFLNSHDIYHLKNNPYFRKTVLFKGENFADGFIVSLYLSLKNLRQMKRLPGPDFTKSFFEEEKLGKKKKHLFIGFEKEDVKKFSEKFTYLNKKNLFYYNPPYIKNLYFPEKEINRISKLINSNNITCVWVGLGCPKQNFLTQSLFKKTGAKAFFNVGAAMDFLLGKKKRSPKIIRIMGIEWLYRLITDFDHSKEKVKRSFISLIYLNKVTLK